TWTQVGAAGLGLCKGPGNREHLNFARASGSQRRRRGFGGCSGGKHVIDQKQRLSGELTDGFETPRHVLLALRFGQAGLAAGVSGSPQALDMLSARAPGDFAAEQLGLVVLPSPKALSVQGNPADNPRRRIEKVLGLADQQLRQKRRQLRMVLVFELVN